MNCKNASFAFLFFLVLFASLPAQTEEPIKESVSVFNVEVPVRVLSDGQSVAGLAREDFQIFEGGTLQVINGFHALHKQMKGAAVDKVETERPLGRYFVLVFHTYDFNPQLEDGLSALFEDILQPDDQLLVMVHDQVRFFERLGTDGRVQAEVNKVVKEESQKAFYQMLSTLKSIEREVNITKFRMTLRDSGAKSLYSIGATQDYVKRFLQNYLDAWRGFKRRYLTLDIDKFYYFSRHLEKIRSKKWVLNFYQLEMFPQIAFGGDVERSLRDFIDHLANSTDATSLAYATMIRQTLNDIHKEMNVSDSFSTEDVSKMFYKVNTTFHSFFIRTFKDSENSELQFKNVATDIENSMRDLTRKTGGELLASTDIRGSLDTIVEKADDYYVLTYEPSDPKKIGKIKVVVQGKKYDILYDNNIRADYINDFLKKKELENPMVKITELSFQKKKLAFVIRDFSQAKLKNETSGLLMVRIRIKNDREQSLFDQSKSLQSAKKTFSLSLDFDFLQPGKYDIIVDVLDQVSGKSCSEVIQPLVK